MAKHPILLLLLAAVLLWAPDLSAQQRKRGDPRKHGRAVARTYDTGDFTQLDISGAWKVVLRQGSRHHVEIKTHSDLHEFVQADVRQGVLRIGFTRSVKHADVRIAYITVPELEGIRVHGASEVEIESNLRAGELRLSAHGAARITGDLDAEVLICNLSGPAGDPHRPLGQPRARAQRRIPVQRRGLQSQNRHHRNLRRLLGARAPDPRAAGRSLRRLRHLLHRQARQDPHREARRFLGVGLPMIFLHGLSL
jgi:hypothetical protein